MTTIEDKLNLFARIVFEKVEKQSEEKVQQVSRQIEERLASEMKRIEEISAQIVSEKVKKSEVKSTQIISQASMEAQQSLLKKKREMLEVTIKDLRHIAKKYVQTPEYRHFLTHAIRRALKDLEGEQQLLFFFTKEDMERHEGLIRDTIVRTLEANAVYTLHPAEREIIGGCLCQNGQHTRRVDCTMVSQLEDQRDMIGQMVMENLQI